MVRPWEEEETGGTTIKRGMQDGSGVNKVEWKD
jgi:hypothetical protein